MDDPRSIERKVADYLRAHGYHQTAEQLTQEVLTKSAAQLSAESKEFAAGPSSASTPTPSIPDFLLVYNENEANNPNAYEQSYNRLRKWVDNSIDVYKIELRTILFPIFVHAYLDLIAKRLPEQASRFWDLYRSDHLETHVSVLNALSSIKNEHHLAENETARQFRSQKFFIRMSRYSFEMLLGFLQDNHFSLLLRLVNEYVNINVSSDRPASDVKDETMTDGPVGLTGVLPEILEKWKKQPLLLGLLPPDITFVNEVERRLKDSGGDENAMLLDGLAKVKQEPNVDAPTRDMVKIPPRKLLDAETEIKALREISKRVNLGPSVLPSICCYTFHNAYDSITCAKMSPDTSMLVAGSSESFIRLWNLDRSKQMRTNGHTDKEDGKQPQSARRLVGHSGPVYGMSFSADQRYLLSCSEDKTARLWSLDTMTNVVAYKGHNYPVWDVAFSPESLYFATASHDRTARLWNCEHVHPLRIFAGHLSDVDVVKFHPNCNYVFTGSSDRTSRMWEVQKGNCVRLFTGHTGAIHALAVSPDGRTLATAGEDKAISLWDLGSSRKIKSMIGHTGMVYSLAFSADGNVLASGGSDCSVRIWDVKKSDTREVAVKVDAAFGGGAGAGFGGGKMSNDLLGTYPTKRTPVYDVEFTRANLLTAVGVFNVP
ncbi:Transcription initiation factor TFIID subunit 5 [Rhizophlyctis rosea]|nr:Transcription initiation factor TFIID subunit 5 [Rhizophlyctis rosea]